MKAKHRLKSIHQHQGESGFLSCLFYEIGLKSYFSEKANFYFTFQFGFKTETSFTLQFRIDIFLKACFST